MDRRQSSPTGGPAPRAREACGAAPGRRSGVGCPGSRGGRRTRGPRGASSTVPLGCQLCGGAPTLCGCGGRRAGGSVRRRNCRRWLGGAAGTSVFAACRPLGGLGFRARGGQTGRRSVRTASVRTASSSDPAARPADHPSGARGMARGGRGHSRGRQLFRYHAEAAPYDAPPGPSAARALTPVEAGLEGEVALVASGDQP